VAKRIVSSPASEQSPLQSDEPAFLFTTCQVGAERTLKAEMARLWPTFHFAFSRPGFLTFKLPPEHRLSADEKLGSVFARSAGSSLGRVSAVDPEQAAREVWQLAGTRPYERLHVWPRDAAEVGHRGYEPGITDLARAAREAILKQAPAAMPAAQNLSEPLARPGELVLDCILVEPDQWWVGFHRADDPPSCWPGGIFEIDRSREVISRAYWKLLEGLAWSKLPSRRGDTWAELGCAPGGASQALLDRGYSVIGIDPAEVDPRLAANPKFTHLRKRSSEVRKRMLRDVKWLAADINVAPAYTLEAVEAITTNAAVKLHGVLLTLKLLDWQLAEEIPAYLERIRGWGFDRAEARQLSHNRQEICVAAWRSDLVRKAPRRPLRHGPRPTRR